MNGPKSWSLAASLHPEISAALDAAQERAAIEIIAWLAEHSTTRAGPRNHQVQVPVEKGLEAAVVRHYTSRASDPDRHLHLQINAKVFAKGKWRALHSVGTRDSIAALNGIGHAAVMCDPQFRAALAAHGYTLDETGEINELAPYAGRFSHRASQIARNAERYEAEWRADHPGQEPGPKLRRAWDRRAWADARPDEIVPTSGAELVEGWNEELHDLGFRPPDEPATTRATAIGQLRRDVSVELILTRPARGAPHGTLPTSAAKPRSRHDDAAVDSLEDEIVGGVPGLAGDEDRERPRARSSLLITVIFGTLADNWYAMTPHIRRQLVVGAKQTGLRAVRSSRPRDVSSFHSCEDMRRRVLTNLLPGVRDTRTPLTVGVAWSLAFWSVFDRASLMHAVGTQELPPAIERLQGAVSGPGLLGLLTGLAYFLGTLMVVLTDRGMAGRLLDWLARKSDSRAETQYRELMQRKSDEIYSLLGARGVLDDTEFQSKIDGDINKALRTRISDMRPLLLAASAELFNEYDRLQNESVLRANLVIPTALVASRFVEDSPRSSIAIAVFVIGSLVVRSIARRREARNLIRSAVVIGVFDHPIETLRKSYSPGADPIHRSPSDE